MTDAGTNSRDWRHWMPRFSLRQLLLATAFVAVGCYALRWASPWWSIVLFYLCLALVLGGVLVAINWPGEPRSFWSGFAVCGIAHWLLVFHPGLDNGVPSLYPQEFATTRLSAFAYQQLESHLTVDPIRVSREEIGRVPGRRGGIHLDGPPEAIRPDTVATHLAGEDGYFRATPGIGRFHINEKDFVQVALGLWTLLLAYLGGHGSLALYRSRVK